MFSQQQQKVVPYLVLALLLCVSAHAETYSEGGEAYEAGDYDKAFQIWKPLAEAGDARAQYGTANLYEHGLGVEPNPVTAAYWLERAAESGVSIAQFRLGNAYHLGDGYPQSDGDALRWWRLAARQGDSGAMYNLGVQYYKGQGVERDEVIAFDWFFKAAGAGDERAKKLFADEGARLAADQSLNSSTSLDPVLETAGDEPTPELAQLSDNQPDSGLPAVSAITGPRLLGHAWILAQDPRHYTIQLAAMSDLEGVQRYLSDYDIAGDIAVFERTTAGKTVLVITYGLFADADSARLALAQLPQAVRAQQVWARSFAEIQELINSN